MEEEEDKTFSLAKIISGCSDECTHPPCCPPADPPLSSDPPGSWSLWPPGSSAWFALPSVNAKIRIQQIKDQCKKTQCDTYSVIYLPVFT